MLRQIFDSKSKNKWIKESYAQCGEDLIVNFIFENIGIKQPSYIDIGAHHPFYLSNTAFFYTKGCSGINIEPDPVLFMEFLKTRKRDINLNCGVLDTRTTADFYIMSVPTLNTFSKIDAESYNKEGDFFIEKIVQLDVLPIMDIINEKCGSKFPEFLTIDAEGIDELVIHSIDFKNNFPLVICVETISFSENGNGIKNEELIAYIKNNGYMHYADTYINSIFVRKDNWVR